MIGFQALCSMSKISPYVKYVLNWDWMWAQRNFILQQINVKTAFYYQTAHSSFCTVKVKHSSEGAINKAKHIFEWRDLNIHTIWWRTVILSQSMCTPGGTSAFTWGWGVTWKDGGLTQLKIDEILIYWWILIQTFICMWACLQNQ